MPQTQETQKKNTNTKKRKSIIRSLKTVIFGEDELTEEIRRNIAPSDVVPERAYLMKNVLIRSRELLDIFRFTLKYKKRSSSGMQFYGMRKYTPEDDASKIDWKTSVRMSAGHEKVDELYLKEYEEELDLATFIMLDTSSTMLFGTKACLKSDTAAIIAATLAYAANAAKTEFGAAIFNDEIKVLHTPRRGEVQFHRFIDSVCDPKNYWGRCNMGKALEFVQESIGSRTLFIIISDFIDINDDWYTSLKQCSEKFDSILGVMIRDPLDDHIPKGLGAMRVSFPYSKNGTELNFDKIRDRYNEEAKRDEEKIKSMLNNVNAGFVKIDTTSDDIIRPFLEYFTLWALGK